MNKGTMKGQSYYALAPSLKLTRVPLLHVPQPPWGGHSGVPGQLPLDLFAYFIVAKPVSQHQCCHGRTQWLDVLLGILTVELKLLRQPLRWISEECFYACVAIVTQRET